MNDISRLPHLTRDQDVSAQCDDRPCCICGNPDAPHLRGASPADGHRGFRYCNDDVPAAAFGVGMPGDSCSGGIVRRKREGGQ